MKGFIAFLLVAIAIGSSSPALAGNDEPEPVSQDERLFAIQALRSEIVSLGKRSRKARKAASLCAKEAALKTRLAALEQAEDELVEVGTDYLQLLEMSLPPRTWRILARAKRRDFESVAKRLRKALDELDPPKKENDDSPPKRRRIIRGRWAYA